LEPRAESGKTGSHSHSHRSGHQFMLFKRHVLEVWLQEDTAA
jgi:hypothetical protein